MLLAIAIGFGLICVVLTPLGDGLFDTSMWAAKIMLPPEAVKNENANQLLKITQAALMEGWLSNIPFVTAMAGLSAVIISGFYHWWLTFVFFVVIVIFRVLVKLFWTRDACYYLLCMHQKMIHRAADYRRDNDLVRFEAAEETCRDLEKIISVYDVTRLKPPTEKQLKEIPYGDLLYWRERWAGK